MQHILEMDKTTWVKFQIFNGGTKCHADNEVNERKFWWNCMAWHSFIIFILKTSAANWPEGSGDVAGVAEREADEDEAALPWTAPVDQWRWNMRKRSFLQKSLKLQNENWPTCRSRGRRRPCQWWTRRTGRSPPWWGPTRHPQIPKTAIRRGRSSWMTARNTNWMPYPTQVTLICLHWGHK